MKKNFDKKIKRYISEILTTKRKLHIRNKKRPSKNLNSKQNLKNSNPRIKSAPSTNWEKKAENPYKSHPKMKPTIKIQN